MGDIDIIDADDIGEPATQVEQDPFDTPPGSPGGGGFVPETPLDDDSPEDMEIETTPVAIQRRAYRPRSDAPHPKTPSIAEERSRRRQRRSKKSKGSAAKLSSRMTRLQMSHLRRIEGIPDAMRTQSERQFLDLYTS